MGKFRQWLKVRPRCRNWSSAQAAAAQKADELLKRRIALAESLETTKGSISALALHTKSAKATDAAPRGAHAAGRCSAPTTMPPTLVTQTKLITADQKVLTLLDRRIADQRQLERDLRPMVERGRPAGAGPGTWVAVERRSWCWVLLLPLCCWRGGCSTCWTIPSSTAAKLKLCARITRVALRVLAVVVILLIAIGMPSQFGTMIGIVGAGLTVALKDFIVAFFGWLVLMGRNGIRLGDWVEINGVSGEVTELGIFHTVLLETGNWSDSGHPTGRRVTFTNSFAIEGHYFNFSTSGQWLWDELQLVVPAGQDPYPIVEAITHQVSEATAESARLAEQEWQRAVPASRGKVFSGTPGVNVKPVVGGVEISVRYITRANERFLQRAKLYQGAVDLLGKKPPTHG